MKRNPPNPPELAHTSLPPGSPPWPLCPQSLLPFLVPQRLSRWTLFRGLLWGRHCAKCWGYRKTWQSHSCFRELTVWQANVAWSRKSSNSRMENKYYKEVEVLKVLLEPLKHMVLLMVAIFLGQLSPNQIISLPTWWLHHHITHTHTHARRAMLSKYVCDGRESTGSDPGMCCVDGKTPDMGGRCSAPVFPSTPHPSPLSFYQTRAGRLLPQEGPKGVHGWHQSHPRPTREAYLGFLTSVILVCSPNSRFRNSSRGPDS